MLFSPHKGLEKLNPQDFTLGSTHRTHPYNMEVVKVNEFPNKGDYAQGTVYTVSITVPTSEASKWANAKFCVVPTHSVTMCHGNNCPLHPLKLPYMRKMDEGVSWAFIAECM
jgi:hypothetical protein